MIGASNVSQNPVEGTLYALNDLHNQMASSIVLDPCDNTTEDAMAAPISVKVNILETVMFLILIVHNAYRFLCTHLEMVLM